MNSIRDAIEALLEIKRNRIKATSWRNIRTASLGDQSGQVIVPEDERTAEGNLYARRLTENEEELLQVANTSGAIAYDNDISAGYPVKVGKMPGSDTLAVMAPAPFDSPNYLGGITPNQYETKVGMVVTPDRIQLARIYAAGDDMLIRVTKFWYRYNNEVFFPRTQVLGDLTSFVPSTSGKSNYVIIGWNFAAYSPVFQAGDEFDTTSGLLLDYTPFEVTSEIDFMFGFVLLDNGQTVIAETDVIPTQEFFGGVASSGGGASTFLDLTDVEPVTYEGKAGRTAIVNSTEDALIFSEFSPVLDASLEWIVESPSRYTFLRQNQTRNIGIVPDYGTANASTTETGFSPDNAFSANNAATWRSTDVVPPHTLGIVFDTAHTIDQYAIQVDSVPDYFPTDFVLEKDIGAGWVTVDTRSSLTWSNFQRKTFSITPQSADKWRIRITAVQSGNIAEIKNFRLNDTIYLSRIAQTFQITRTGNVESSVWMQRSQGATGPAGGMVTKIHNDAAGEVGTVLATSSEYNTATATDDFEEIEYTFATTPSVMADTDYWLVASGDFPTSYTAAMILGSEVGSPYTVKFKVEYADEFNNTFWVDQNTDNNIALCFKLTIEGFGIQGFNPDKILSDSNGDVLTDSDGNVLTEV